MSRALRRVALVLFFASPSLAAIVWSTWPSLQALSATEMYTLPKMSPQDWEDAARTTELRRALQHHFLNHNIYIPLEDIVATSGSGSDGNDLALLMQKACGRGRLFVWIPLKFRVPITGEKVIEWCWKPQASNS